jgi:thioredoxin reductase
MTSVPGVFTAGDMQRGHRSSLGNRRRRQAARAVDAYLMS